MCDPRMSDTACEHGAAAHDGSESGAGTVPEAARAWLLIEHDGPWPAEAVDADLPAPLRDLAALADKRGIRVQLIRRAGQRRVRGGKRGVRDGNGDPAVFAGWTAGSSPWLRRGGIGDAGVLGARLEGLAEGIVPDFGTPAADPLFLVCTHGRRDVCCARYGGPLARALAARYPGQVWETTHVGGHRYAANLVLLPHGLYYGPVDEEAAVAAITAYQRGEAVTGRYRGRAGQPRSAQFAGCARLCQAGRLPIDGLTLGVLLRAVWCGIPRDYHAESRREIT